MVEYFLVFPGGLVQQRHRRLYVAAVGHANGDLDTGGLVRQRPVEQAAGNELLVGYQQLLSIPVTDGGCANLDAGDGTAGITDGDDIANPDGAFESRMIMPLMKLATISCRPKPIPTLRAAASH